MSTPMLLNKSNYGTKNRLTKIINLFSLFLLASCSSTTPITRTYKEYIPPIHQEGLDCISKLNEETKKINLIAQQERKNCKTNAEITAQATYQQALLNHQNEMDNMRKRWEYDNHQRQLQDKEALLRYNECLKQQEIQRARQGTGAFQAYSKPCIQPVASANNQAYFPQNSLPKPDIREFINDSHCDALIGDHISQYDSDYVKTCYGNIVITTRCFANCEEK